MSFLPLKAAKSVNKSFNYNLLPSRLPPTLTADFDRRL
jgi:hypothetical protein